MNYKEINKNIDDTFSELYMYQGKVLTELKLELNSKLFYIQSKKLFNLDKRTTNRLIEFYNMITNSSYDLPNNFELFMLIYDKLRNEKKNVKGVSEVYGIVKINNDVVNKYSIIEYFNNLLLKKIRNRSNKIKDKVNREIISDKFNVGLLNFDIKRRIELESEEEVLKKYNNYTVYYFRIWNNKIGEIDTLFKELKNETLKVDIDTKKISKISNEINKLKKEEIINKNKLNEIIQYKKDYVKSQEKRLHK